MRPPIRSSARGDGRSPGRSPGRFSGGGRGGGGGRGAGRGGRSFQRDEGPPAEIVEAGSVLHECESELVCRWTLDEKVPYFNAGVYLENKRKIGKVDEILGKVSEIYFTVKMDPGILSKSFKQNDLVYVGMDKILPLSRFTNPNGGGGGGRGGPRGAARGRGGRGRSGRSPMGGGRGGGRSGRSQGGGGRGSFRGGRVGGRRP